MAKENFADIRRRDPSGALEPSVQQHTNAYLYKGYKLSPLYVRLFPHRQDLAMATEEIHWLSKLLQSDQSSMEASGADEPLVNKVVVTFGTLWQIEIGSCHAMLVLRWNFKLLFDKLSANFL